MPVFSSPLSSSSTFLPKARQCEIQPQLPTDPPSRVKIPTAPWMTTPPDHDHLSDPLNTGPSDPSIRQSPRTRSLTSRIPGGRTRKTVLEIIKSVKSLQQLDPIDQFEKQFDIFEERGKEIEKPNLPWVGGKTERDNEIMVFRREKQIKEVTEAEKRIPAEELERLRKEGRRMKIWTRAKKAGITSEVIEEIERTWRHNELAMVKIVDPLRKNMERAHKILEAKTGGLVVLRRADKLVIYRNPPKKSKNASFSSEEITIQGSLYERETDRLLDSLGPRFIDWWWNGPLPVDADLLPEYISGFKTPYRRCPPGVQVALSDKELTWLRLVTRSLPTHFALGRSKRLQGLAEAIIKLWEKSFVAKIAIKVGLLDTNHVVMASELKQLTGGVVILRNKDFIILYRGKDFITEKIANSISEREMEIHEIQDKEEEARSKAVNYFRVLDRSVNCTGSSGSFREYQDLKSSYFEGENENYADMMRLVAEKENLVKEIRDQENQLFSLSKKIQKSEREMEKLHTISGSIMQNSDKELLTEEEKRTFRSIGRRMDQCLKLGRRGIYDGVIANAHQHWKHREVVKVITQQTEITSVIYTAKLLELMTGGNLLAMDKVRSHYEILIYRGKNYKRPLKLLPDNLLNKKEAFKRSIEVQRRGSMKFYARRREQSIMNLKLRLKYLEAEIAKIASKKAEMPS